MKKLLFFSGVSLVILLGASCTNKSQVDNYSPRPAPVAQNSIAGYTQPSSTTVLTVHSTSTTSSKDTETNNSNSNKPMDLSEYKTPITLIDQSKTYTAKVKTTAGDMEISLNAKATPITVNNFVFLAKKHFYDNVIFHRAIKGFMIQGGDPTGTGAGGPGYRFNDEPFAGEYSRGTIAMANAGPNTNGSQFFIMHADYPLPPNYVIFGKVSKGLDVVDKVAEAPVTMSDTGEMSKPINPVKIISVEIIEK